MTTINTNVSSLLAKNALVANERSMSTAMERLSTGVRINSAQDDAAGLAIASKMTSQIRGLDQAVRNANDAVSLIQTAEGALIETSNMLQRMRELAVQASSDTNTLTDRTALNQEFVSLRSEINRVAQNTQWNGVNILTKQGGSNSDGIHKFQVGANANQTIDLTIGNYQTNSSSQTAVATVETTTSGSGQGATPAAQVSTFTIANTVAVGDVFNLTVGDKSFTHTVTSITGTAATDRDNVFNAMIAGIGAVTGVASSETTTGTGAKVQTFKASATQTYSAPTTAFGSNSFNISSGAGGLLTGIKDSSITTAATANSAVAAVSTALATVNAGRSEMGATMNRLQYAADNLANVSRNATESRGRVMDADYAKETTELARTQIISQAGTAMLAQANQMKQTVLSLLK
jgi:flagellin